jgi:uncharacterized protein YuzE
MKLSYDPDADSLWIRWNDLPIDESDEIEPGAILDYDKDGNVVGIEILHASKKIENLPSISAAKTTA